MPIEGGSRREERLNHASKNLFFVPKTLNKLSQFFKLGIWKNFELET